MSLSKKSAELLNYLQERLTGNRAAPSYDEMAAAIRLKTKSNIKRYLAELRDAGHLTYEEGKSRAIALLNTATPILRVPIGGSISAGRPIPSFNRLDPSIGYEPDYLTFAADQFPKTNLGALIAFRVDGDSMIDANVQHGDWVILTTEFSPSPNDILAFWLQDDQSLTLKHYDRDGDHILLLPANANYAPIRKHRDNVEAYGKVVMVQRQFAA